MDKMGRRPVLILGGIMAAISLVALGAFFLIGNIIGMILSFFVYGIGFAVLSQNRVAVADMYPDSKLGNAVGYLYTSSVIGSLVAVPFVSLVEPLSQILKINSYSVLWIAASTLLLLVIGTTVMISPDTKEIAPLVKKNDVYQKSQRNFNSSSSLKSATMISCFVASTLSTGTMVAMMSLFPLYLNQQHLAITLISIAVTIHVIGMYGFSVLFGRMTDRLGAKTVMIIGILVTGAGALLMTLTSNYYIITLGIFLVGLGWSATTVCTTALIASLTETSLRGRVLGLNDVFIGGAAVAAPLVGGVIIGAYGFFAFGVYGFLLSVPGAFLALTMRSRAALISQEIRS